MIMEVLLCLYMNMYVRNAELSLNESSKTRKKKSIAKNAVSPKLNGRFHVFRQKWLPRPVLRKAPVLPPVLPGRACTEAAAAVCAESEMKVPAYFL